MKPFDYEKYLRNNPLLKEEKMEEGPGILRRMKNWAGEKGIGFGSARRPTEEENQIAREYMQSVGKELGSIGVDKITGNINVMEPNGDFRAILSPDGEELSAYEMDIHENEQLNETDFKEITGKLTSALESMGYEVEYEPSYYGYPSIMADKPIGEGHLRVWIQPSYKELQSYRDKYKDDPTGPTAKISYSTVDVEFVLWKPEVVKKFFGLFKSKKLTGRNFPEESGMDIDLGSGMFNIPIEDSVNRIIAVVKKGEQKAMSMMGMNEMDVEPEV